MKKMQINDLMINDRTVLATPLNTRSINCDGSDESKDLKNQKTETKPCHHLHLWDSGSWSSEVSHVPHDVWCDLDAHVALTMPKALPSNPKKAEMVANTSVWVCC